MPKLYQEIDSTNGCPRCGSKRMKRRKNRKLTGETLQVFKHKGICTYKLVEAAMKRRILKAFKSKQKEEKTAKLRKKAEQTTYGGEYYHKIEIK